MESKCYFVGNLILVLDLNLLFETSLTTSAEVPVQILGMVEFFFYLFKNFSYPQLGKTLLISG